MIRSDTYVERGGKGGGNVQLQQREDVKTAPPFSLHTRNPQLELENSKLETTQVSRQVVIRQVVNPRQAFLVPNPHTHTNTSQIMATN